MGEFDDKLNTLLGNPQLMQQIMKMAQTLNTATPASESPKQESPPDFSASIPDIDPAMITKIMNLAGKATIDQSQRSLLHALQPYLSKEKLQKLEKAMRAAKLSAVASDLLQSGTIPFLTGR